MSNKKNDGLSPLGTLYGFFTDKRPALIARAELAQGPAPHAALIHRDDSGRTTVDNQGGLDSALIKSVSRWILKGEALLVVQAPLRDMDAAFAVLRRAKGGRPVTFVFAPQIITEASEEAITMEVGAGPLLRATPLTGERLDQDAEQLAIDLVATQPANAEPGRLEPSPSRHTASKTHASLLYQLRRSESVITQVRDRLDLANRLNLPTSAAVDWLLDNAFLIREHIEDVGRSLSRGFLGRLPIVAHESGVGVPRAYRVAARLVADSDARLDSENIVRFLQAFQGVTPLEMSELWAMPLLLRLRLMEVLRHISLAAEVRQRERDQADFWASRLLTSQRRDPDRLADLVDAITAEAPNPTPHLIDQLIGHLQDEEKAQSLVRAWAENALREPVGDIINRAQSEQAAGLVSLSHAIGSLRQLAQLNWKNQFESLSRVHAILEAGDPVQVYGRMDFASRDQYRHAVEEIARDAPHAVTETDVADHVREMARLGEDELRRHVGYYLLDKGRTALEKRVASRPPVATRVRRFARKYANVTYPGAIVLLTLLITSVVLGGTSAGVVWALLGLLALLPASELAAQLVNFMVTRGIPPTSLPKLDFVELGIPDDCRTLVVVPMMLLTPAAIAAEVERLEIRFLANPGKNLKYALLADYADSPIAHMPEDAERLDEVARGIDRLNGLYGADRFYLFHRERKWSETEDRWIGWERKRGKLEMLNAFLRNDGGAEVDNMLRVGDRNNLRDIRFVITLDADTQLPRDTAARLVGTIAHPLNAPRLSLDGRSVDRGYTIIQPRVTTSLPSATETRFSRVFTPFAGTDPYTNAVSDVYQDVAGRGSYHGKGIYDVTAFHRVLGGRFPEAHLLSHDLIEGNYVNVGLASDIELFDQFPRDYQSFMRRAHRWIRGDWQIMDWLGRTVPAGKGKREKNPLDLLSRWKIFDNLRRSLLPVATILLLVIGWLFSSDPARWTQFIVTVYLFPVLVTFVTQLFNPAITDKRSWREFTLTPIRAIVDASLMPYATEVSLSAIGLVLTRRRTHRNLLEWETAAESRTRAGDRRRAFLWRIAGISAASVAIAALLLFLKPSALLDAAPILTLWLLAPVVVASLDESVASRETQAERELGAADRRELRALARRTWRYFDDFVGAQSNHLPPDNYQEFEGRGIAARTSPTNIGLYLLAVIAAHDFGYLTLDAAYDRTQATLDTLDDLEKVEGHLLNWYDTTTRAPLHPRYVSWVDSGNLLACLWTELQACDDLIEQPIVGPAALHGLADTLGILLDALRSAASVTATTTAPDFIPLGANANALDVLAKLCEGPFGGLDDLVQRLRAARQPAAVVLESVADSQADASARYWAAQIVSQVTAFNDLIDRYLGWVEVLASSPDQGMLTLGQEAHEWRRQALEGAPSLLALSLGDAGGLAPLIGVRARASALHLGPDMMAWLDRLHDLSQECQWNASERVADIRCARAQADQLANHMSVPFLYDHDRRAFRIGYNVEDRRADNSYYDLLASESRLGSFVAVASGQVPMEHWWALGRPFGEAQGRRILLSWSGTMFEYLMPLLLMRSYDNSLLDEAMHAVVACQMDYARERGIPWGISEAAYSALDAAHTYQYYAFGVPNIGMKRGLEDGLVVAPYATALALPVRPGAAMENIRRLTALGLRTDRGLYESIDYTRQTDPTGERGVPVQCFMAHHQGMSLLAIDNVLNDGIMQTRFHSDGRVRATESLLHERIPFAPPLAEGAEREAPPLLRILPEEPAPPRGQIDKPNTTTPRTHLLSNGAYHVMVTNAGGGYSRLRDAEIVRWRADTTRDSSGAFLYVRDTDSGAVWSAAYQPTLAEPEVYSVLFTTEKAEFRRRDHDIETFTEICVSPEDNAEVRRVTLINKSGNTRHIELTSYAEVALAGHNADRAHPAFSKLFVETEALRRSGNSGEVTGLLAWRRPRSESDPVFWAGHTVAIEDSSKVEGAAQFETNRASFLGRGRAADRPVALEGSAPLGGGEGAVLDPVFSLRRRVTLAPGDRVHLSFVTVAGATRDEVMALTDKYRDYPATRRALELAWNRAQLELRHLRLTQDEVQRFQQLAGYVLYPQASLRTTEERLKRNVQGQQELWKYGISGDLPIVVVTIRDLYDAYVVREVLLAHTYWNLRGLKVDLVILNEEAITYDQPLQNQLARLIQTYAQVTGTDQPGGVFLRPAKDMTDDDRTLVLSAARVVLIAARGPLAQQIAFTVSSRVDAPVLLPMPSFAEAPGETEALTPIEIKLDNGYGGFTPDGSEYVVNLDGIGQNTPAPWINVIAGPSFGTLVTEAGIGYTWHGNSQSNRITPWSNDPISNPIGDALYLRDEDSGALWSPTPLPIREDGQYRTRHGQGYTTWERNSHGIAQELTVFVPVNDPATAHIEHTASRGIGDDTPPVRIQILKLRNTSGRARRLSATAYVEWVLGVEREDMQMYVVTEWDPATGAMLARNGYRADYADCVGFLAASVPGTSYTGNRTEFLGRNGSAAAPYGLLNGKPLSSVCGAGPDPCGALQVEISLEPGAETEIVFLLGEADNRDAATALIHEFRAPEAANTALQGARDRWKTLLGTVTVETPDEGIDFLLNRWLLYQDMSCRLWGRSAFYQSGGAFGFRDQLQDVMAVLYAAPSLARAQIVLSSSRQFVEGDVQHWWLPPSGAGVRTKISDDLLWLPYVTAQYIRVTGDATILDEETPFLTGKILGPDDHETMFPPAVTEEKATLVEHCRRAIRKGFTKSELHGLPLIGGGDWNDGMNRVGIGGKGESVWLAWFLTHVLDDWADILHLKGLTDEAEAARESAAELAKTIEATAWDGAWYTRAYYDDGTPLGSSQTDEDRIDSLPQSWSVISGHGDPVRSAQAMRSVEEHLVKRFDNSDAGMILLFTPALDKTTKDPGYIKGYLPGVRENGGQYTHGSLWTPLAYARMGDGDRAVELLRRMSPVEHTRSREATDLYKVEPYVVVADIYALPGQVGRGGWTWYTGSAGWMYRVWLEEVLGLRIFGGSVLAMNPCIAKDWAGFTLSYRFGSTTYKVTVENPDHVCRGVKSVSLDGAALPEMVVRLADDGAEHAVTVVLGATG